MRLGWDDASLNAPEIARIPCLIVQGRHDEKAPSGRPGQDHGRSGSCLDDKAGGLLGAVGTAVFMPVVMAVWFAPLLVVFHDLTPLAAMKSSFASESRRLPASSRESLPLASSAMAPCLKQPFVSRSPRETGLRKTWS